MNNKIIKSIFVCFLVVTSFTLGDLYGYRLRNLFSYKHKYYSNQCFKDGFSVIEITTMSNTHYYIKFHNLITTKRQIKFEIFDKNMEEKGLVVESCDNYHKKDKK